MGRTLLFPRLSRLLLAGLAVAGCLPAVAADPELLSIREAITATLTDQGGPHLVCVRGIVTWVVAGRSTITIEDKSAAIWVNCFHDASFQQRWREIGRAHV